MFQRYVYRKHGIHKISYEKVAESVVRNHAVSATRQISKMIQDIARHHPFVADCFHLVF